MTVINSLSSARQVAFTSNKKQEQKKPSALNTAAATGGTFGFAVDQLLNVTKTVPNSLMKKIDAVLKKKPDFVNKDFVETMEAAKQSLTTVVEGKYGFFDRIINSTIRHDSEAAFIKLAKFQKDNPHLIPEELRKPVAKLAKIGGNAAHNLSGNIFKNTFIRSLSHQVKHTVIGTVLALAGILTYNSAKNSKSQQTES